MQHCAPTCDVSAFSGRALSPQREQLCPSNPTSCLTLNFLMLLVKGMDREKRGDRGERGEREERERAQKETMRIREPGRQGS